MPIPANFFVRRNYYAPKLPTFSALSLSDEEGGPRATLVPESGTEATRAREGEGVRYVLASFLLLGLNAGDFDADRDGGGCISARV